MIGFEPMINLLVLLTILSVVAERITNTYKLNNDSLRERESADRAHEQRIQNANFLISIALALLMKADLFAILSNLEDPWKTLGWLRATGGHMFLTESTHAVGPFIMAVVGCVFTGFALGFGSKFWHDLLGSILEMRKRIRSGRTCLNARQPEVTHVANVSGDDVATEEGDENDG